MSEATTRPAETAKPAAKAPARPAKGADRRDFLVGLIGLSWMATGFITMSLALLGMVATHLLLEIGPDGEQTWPHDLAGGRASALFAVLAGVTLALLTGGRKPLRGRDRWRCHACTQTVAQPVIHSATGS